MLRKNIQKNRNRLSKYWSNLWVIINKEKKIKIYQVHNKNNDISLKNKKDNDFIITRLSLISYSSSITLYLLKPSYKWRTQIHHKWLISCFLAAYKASSNCRISGLIIEGFYWLLLFVLLLLLLVFSIPAVFLIF